MQVEEREMWRWMFGTKVTTSDTQTKSQYTDFVMVTYKQAQNTVFFSIGELSYVLPRAQTNERYIKMEWMINKTRTHWWALAVSVYATFVRSLFVSCGFENYTHRGHILNSCMNRLTVGFFDFINFYIVHQAYTLHTYSHSYMYMIPILWFFYLKRRSTSTTCSVYNSIVW